MTRRMIDAGIWANEHFAMLPPMARLLQIGIINLADDQGRMKAHPAYLRSQIFPYDEVPADDVQSWLDLIAANGTLMLYEADGKAYLQLLNWWQYQSPAFASPSQYPRPEGWQDRVRYTGKSRIIYTCNWSTSSGELLPDTCDQDGNPLPKGAEPHGQPPARPPGQPPGQPGTRLIEDKYKYKTTTTTTSAGGENCGGGGGESDIAPVIEAWGEYEMTPKATKQTAQRLRDDVTQHGAPYVLECIRIAADAGQPTMRYYRGVLRKGPDSPRASPNGTGQYAGWEVVPDEGDDDG